MESYISIDGWKANIRFSSAHVIPEYEKCGRLHGHTYAVHVKIYGETDEKGIIIDFSITTFGGRLLVDMAHHSAEDADDPSAYKYFREYLLEQGVVLSETSTMSVDISELSTSEVFMIMDTETAYGSNEINALHQFVEDGGLLIVLSESYDDHPQFTGVSPTVA